MKNFEGMFRRVLGSIIKGAGVVGGCYFAFKENDWVLGGIIGGSCYAFGNLIIKSGYEKLYQERIDEIEEFYQKETKNLEVKYEQYKEELKEEFERYKGRLERLLKNNSK